MDIIFLIVILIVPAIAALNVRLTFSKYKNITSHSGFTADDAARAILDSNGLSDVSISRVSGDMTDHYDPTSNTVYLSDTVSGSRSIAAIGVAAHECGHAIQHGESYAPVVLRSRLVPATNICSYGSYLLVTLGFIFRMNPTLIRIGAFVFLGVVIFKMITLPVEFDASSRALRILGGCGYLDSEELKGTKKVLTAAALTYVASLFTALLHMLRLFALSRRRR